jgi:hypothetical protein
MTRRKQVRMRKKANAARRIGRRAFLDARRNLAWLKTWQDVAIPSVYTEGLGA